MYTSYITTKYKLRGKLCWIQWKDR